MSFGVTERSRQHRSTSFDLDTYFTSPRRSSPSIPTWLKHKEKAHKHEPDDDKIAGRPKSSQSRGRNYNDGVHVDAASLLEVTSRFLRKMESKSTVSDPGALHEAFMRCVSNYTVREKESGNLRLGDSRPVSAKKGVNMSVSATKPHKATRGMLVARPASGNRQARARTVPASDVVRHYIEKSKAGRPGTLQDWLREQVCIFSLVSSHRQKADGSPH